MCQWKKLTGRLSLFLKFALSFKLWKPSEAFSFAPRKVHSSYAYTFVRTEFTATLNSDFNLGKIITAQAKYSKRFYLIPCKIYWLEHRAYF